MIRPPPRSTLFPSRRSSDLGQLATMDARLKLAGAPAQIVTFVWVRARGETTIQSAAAQPRPHCRNRRLDRKSTRLNSSHSQISYAVFCLKKKRKTDESRH